MAEDATPFAALSLLSLAASTQPPGRLHILTSTGQITPPPRSPSPLIADHNHTVQLGPVSPIRTSAPRAVAQKHRRLSSAGQRGRRLSEATAATIANATVRGVSVS